MRRPRQPLPTDRRAVAAVEFALLAGALISLCIGTIEVGLLFWGQNALESAAVETARCVAIQSPDCSNAQTYGVDQVTKWMFSGIVTPSNVTAQTATSCNGASGNFQVVTITTSYFANWLPPFMPQFANKTLSATACYPM